MPVKLSAASGGSVTIEPTNTASNYTLTVPAQTGTIAINGPAFSAYQSSAQTVATNTVTKIQFQTEEFDTNNNFASSTFTPTVAGYYQVSAGFGIATSNCAGQLRLYKNGTTYKFFGSYSTNCIDQIQGSALVYCNGTTDYLDIYCYISIGQNIINDAIKTYFQASMVRAA